MPEERGQAIAIYSLAPLLGPIIGPVAGAWIAERSTWRWVFWSTTIVDAAVQVLGLFYLRESVQRCVAIHLEDGSLICCFPAYAPFLLEQRAKEMRQRNDVEGNMRVRTVYDDKIDRECARYACFRRDPPLTDIQLEDHYEEGLDSPLSAVLP